MKKYPAAAADADIERCRNQIKMAQAGGETKPYAKDEWIACMNRRIAVNEIILKQYGLKTHD